MMAEISVPAEFYKHQIEKAKALLEPVMATPFDEWGVMEKSELRNVLLVLRAALE